MSPPPIRVCISVLVYQGRAVIERCLESLARQSFPEGAIDIHVLDNGSPDGSWEFLNELQLRHRWPNVALRSNPANVGFAAGHNSVLKSTAGRYDYFILVNQDTCCADAETVAGLVRASRGLHDEALVQPLVKDFHGRPVSSGLAVTYTGNASPTLQPLPGRPGGPVPIDAAHAVFLLMSRRTLETVGFLEESYFAYHEDVEYAMRARLSGIGSWCVPDIEVFHEQSPERFRKNKSAQYLMERNRYRYLLSYFRWPILLALLPALVAQEAAFLAWLWLCGNGAAKWRAYKDTFSDWPQIRALRMSAQKRLARSAFRRKFYLSHRAGIGVKKVLGDPAYPLPAKAGAILLEAFHRLYYVVYRLVIWAEGRP